MPDEHNLQDPATVARVILFAVQMPPESALQEVIVTPLTETSWPLISEIGRYVEPRIWRTDAKYLH